MGHVRFAAAQRDVQRLSGSQHLKIETIAEAWNERRLEWNREERGATYVQGYFIAAQRLSLDSARWRAGAAPWRARCARGEY
jgi:hypothetical protein